MLGWPVPEGHLIDLPDALQDLRPHLPGFVPILEDLANIPDEDLQGDAAGRLALRLLKHSRDADIWAALLADPELLSQVAAHPDPRAPALFLH